MDGIYGLFRRHRGVVYVEVKGEGEKREDG
jgi:hypothetical protein